MRSQTFEPFRSRCASTLGLIGFDRAHPQRALLVALQPQLLLARPLFLSRLARFDPFALRRAPRLHPLSLPRCRPPPRRKTRRARMSRWSCDVDRSTARRRREEISPSSPWTQSSDPVSSAAQHCSMREFCSLPLELTLLCALPLRSTLLLPQFASRSLTPSLTSKPSRSTVCTRREQSRSSSSMIAHDRSLTRCSMDTMERCSATGQHERDRKPTARATWCDDQLASSPPDDRTEQSADAESSSLPETCCSDTATGVSRSASFESASAPECSRSLCIRSCLLLQSNRNRQNLHVSPLNARTLHAISCTPLAFAHWLSMHCALSLFPSLCAGWKACWTTRSFAA